MLQNISFVRQKRNIINCLLLFKFYFKDQRCEDVSMNSMMGHPSSQESAILVTILMIIVITVFDNDHHQFDDDDHHHTEDDHHHHYYE